MSAKISCVIPAYNAGIFIGDAINSVLAQSYSAETEIIVIDDGSFDDTKTIVSEISQRYQQILCVPNERKKGPSGARNTGLLRASGAYVAFLDADDIWFSNHLEEGMGFLEKNTDVDVVFFNFELVDFETKRRISDWFTERSFTKNLRVVELDRQYHLICDDMFNALLDESFMHLPAMIIRKEKLKGILFNEDIKHSEDRDFSIKLFQISKARFAFKNLITGVYFRHGNSLTSESIENTLSTALDHITLFTGYLSSDLLDTFTASKLKKMLFDRYMSASYCYRKMNNYKLSVASLYRSLSYNITVSQLIEFAKLNAQLAISIALQRTRRST